MDTKIIIMSKKKNICVLCGAEWLLSIKNRCECGGFCTWGTEPTKPDSFFVDTNGNWIPKPPPRHKHDCDECKILGYLGEMDLYFCNNIIDLPTVIARFGSNGWEYMSGMLFTTSDGVKALYEAKKLAIKYGYFKEEE